MVKDYDVPVKYTKLTTTVTTYDTGLKDWEGIDSLYKDQLLRNKVVCKFDATVFLKMYFNIDTIKKYRPVLMLIAKGLITDPVKFSNCIKDFIKMDDKFRSSIQDIYNSCPEDRSFGGYIIDVMADVFKTVENTYRGFFRGKSEVVICVSDGYLYFSVDDVLSIPTLPDKVECEVLSYAKNWRGEFQFNE